MVDEYVHAYVIGEDDLSTTLTVPEVGVVRCRRVQLGEQESRLRAPLIALHETRRRTSLCRQSFCVAHGRREQGAERLVFWLILVSGFVPRRDRASSMCDYQEV